MDNKYKLHGAFSWCELLTTDVPEAKRFYTSALLATDAGQSWAGWLATAAAVIRL